MKKNKRPIWVWVIFLWFTFGGLSSLYTFYTVQSGTIALPKGVEQPSGVFYFAQAYGFAFLAMIAGIMLFIRIAANRWLFAAMFILSIPSALYTIMSDKIPQQNYATTFILIIGVLVIYALITRYSFKLLSANYYIK